MNVYVIFAFHLLLLSSRYYTVSAAIDAVDILPDDWRYVMVVLGSVTSQATVSLHSIHGRFGSTVGPGSSGHPSDYAKLL